LSLTLTIHPQVDYTDFGLEIERPGTGDFQDRLKDSGKGAKSIEFCGIAVQSIQPSDYVKYVITWEFPHVITYFT